MSAPMADRLPYFTIGHSTLTVDALAEHLQIGGENQRRAFGRLRTLDEVFDKFAVAHHIKLKPKRCTGVFGHIFNRANRHGGKRKRHTEFFGGARG